MNKKIFAFTLSEVLITLGIIGVVAALTIPNVVKNYQKKQTIVMLRRAYTNLQTAIRMSVAENGDIANWDLIGTNTNDYPTPAQKEEFVQKYFLPYFKTAKFYTNNNGLWRYKLINGVNKGFWVPAILCNDGSLYSFTMQNNYIWIIMDINGSKGPNKMGRDIFVAGIYFNELKKYNTIRFWGAKDSILNKTTDNYGCNKQSNDQNYAGFFCGAWIERNNWEIPDDYPW